MEQILNMNIEEKIEYEPNSGCWLWIGARRVREYGSIQQGDKSILAHRYVYEQHRGPIPEGKELDHLCRVPSCVNPSHLEPVSHAMNMQRALRKTHCKRGHDLRDSYQYAERRGRACKRCAIDRATTWNKERKRALRQA
jgi:hypothetical protein